MIPNKIYTDGKSTYATMPVFSNNDSNIVYLHKDAILNKLKEKRDACVYRSTYWDFWQAVINQINEI